MKSISKNKIDLVITDPPFAIALTVPSQVSLQLKFVPVKLTLSGNGFVSKILIESIDT